MKILVDIILRFLAQILGRWISFSIVKTIVIDFIAANKTAFLLFVAELVKDVLHWIADNVDSDDIRHPQQAVLRFLLEKTGLELEGFTKEDMLKAAGKLIANKVNAQYGTTFKPFYPLENIIEQLKQELLAEVLREIK